jgi:hypothetical protein
MKIDFLPPPNMKVPGTDEIRIMTPEEIALEEPIFAATGNPLPHPSSSVFFGVFRGGKRVAFVVLQTRVHVEPLYIEEGHSAVLPSLLKYVEEYILRQAGPMWVYAFTPAGRITQLARSFGMQMEPWVVMSKLVMPTVPAKGVADLSVEPVYESPPEEAVQ